MSAFGPKRTSLVAPHMSAFRGKADMTVCRCPLSRSLLGVKRTWVVALHMSAFDPKRTSGVSRDPSSGRLTAVRWFVLSLGATNNEAARIHHPCRRRGGCGVFCCASPDSEGAASHRPIYIRYASSAVRFAGLGIRLER